jgi:hypothetical protein
MAVWGKLEAEPLVAAPPAGGEGAAAAAPAAGQPAAAGADQKTTTAEPDKSLPDPTFLAALLTLGLFAVAVVVGVALNCWLHATAKPFDPSLKSTANFALFAGFYVGAQVIERLMEFVAPVLPPGGPTKWLSLKWALGGRKDYLKKILADDAAMTAQIKADRAKLALGVAAVLGVFASCKFGLFFLSAIGMNGISHTVDSIVTGIVIAAGTKPLHDFITSLQNTNTPATPTGTTGTTTST